MITEFFVNMLAGFLSWIASLFGPWTPPAELTQFIGVAKSTVEGIQGLSPWVDWGFLSLCIVLQVGAWAAVAGIKLIRALAAHIPAFGGAGD